MIEKLTEQSQRNFESTTEALRAQRDEDTARYQESLIFRQNEVDYRNDKDIENKEIRETEKVEEKVRYQVSLDLTKERNVTNDGFNNSIINVLGVLAESIKDMVKKI
jgi:hypothetical protein